MGIEVKRCKAMLEPPAIVAGGMIYKQSRARSGAMRSHAYVRERSGSGG
jgi:hypothetical protein